MRQGKLREHWYGIVAICNRISKPAITNPYEEQHVIPFSRAGLEAYKALFPKRPKNVQKRSKNVQKPTEQKTQDGD